MLNQFLNKTFGLRDGERYISFLMQLYIFLIITVLLIVKPTVNALFLSELGSEHLPYGYILVALTAVVTITYYNKAAKKFSLLKVTSISLLAFGIGFLILSFFLSYKLLNAWVLYIYYVGVSLFAVVATSQFWILANLVFNSREAKRLFGFIGAGAIAGGIFGGYLTSVISSAFGNVVAVLIAAVFLLSCIPIMHKIWKLRIKELNPYIRSQRKENESNPEQSAFKIILKSKHLSYLAAIIGLGVIVAKLVDFQFSDFAHQAFSNSDDLASFFGFWFSTFNVVALALQLFATNRVLSKLGVSTTLLILPLGIALGCLLFLAFPELWVLVIIKGIDGSFKQSLNKAAVELSIMPIPFHEKNQAKSFIDVAVDSIATGLAGLMLILLVRKFNLPTNYITIIILLLSFVWTLLIYKLREAYFNSFRNNIQRMLTKKSIGTSKSKKDSSLNYTRKVLNSGEEDEILNALKYLSQYRISALKKEIIDLLDYPSHKVKTRVIKQLYAYDKGTAIEKVKSLIHEDNDELVYNALEYILEHSYTNQNDFFKTFLNHSNTKIASAALLCLANEVSSNDKLAKQYELEKRIADKIEELGAVDGFSRQEDVAKLLITIAHSRIKKYYTFITINLINNTNPYIVKHAIKAAGITAESSYQLQLLGFLAEKEYRKTTLRALRNYGSKITQTILKLEKKEVLSDMVKKHIPSVISSFNSQSSVKILFRLLKSKDIVIRYESADALTKLKSQNESLYFNKRNLKKIIAKESKYCKTTLDAIASLKEILDDNANDTNDTDIEITIARQGIVNVLEEQLDLSLRNIFKILSLIYDEADINVSYNGIISDVKEARINALEFLDNLLKSQLKTQILPLIEYYSIEKNENDTNALKINYLNEEHLFKKLVQQRGKRIKLEILFLIKLLDSKNYKPLVLQLTKHKSEEVNSLAKGIYTSLNS